MLQLRPNSRISLYREAEFLSNRDRRNHAGVVASCIRGDRQAESAAEAASASDAESPRREITGTAAVYAARNERAGEKLFPGS